MKLSRNDLRRVFRNITDYNYLNIENNDNGSNKKEYFEEMWNLINKEFIFDTGFNAFKIECNKDNESNLKFLRGFIILNSDIDLKFNISNKEEKVSILIFKKFLNNYNLTEIMKLIYDTTCLNFKNI
jgi:hypothetical protein